MRQKFLCLFTFQLWSALVLGLGWWILAQAQPLSPQDHLAQCQWDVRQLRASREQAERNVSLLGAQVDKLQAELDKIRQEVPARE